MKILEGFALASQLHAGHEDLAGRPYIDHLSRVCRVVQERGGSLFQQLASLFHDSIEDGRASAQQLLEAGVPPEAVHLVQILTRVAGEQYSEFIERVCALPDAVLIKLADVEDNLQPQRLALLPLDRRTSLEARYVKARARLVQALGDPDEGVRQ